MKVAETIISQGIFGIQNALGERPEGMAARIGCSFFAYIQWIKGERVPGGDWLLKILTLAPNRETLEAFGLDLSRILENRRSVEEEDKDKDRMVGKLRPDVEPKLPSRRKPGGR